MSLPASVLGTTHYLGFDDPSGYAVAAKRCFGALAAAGADVVWVPFTPSWDWELGYAPLVPSSVGGSPDTVVAHLPAEYYGRVRECYPEALVVGHTVWETERIPSPWLGLLEVPDLLVVPTAWNARTMTAAGVSTPVGVVPHATAPAAEGHSETWAAGEGAFVFYTIAPWTARKSVWNTVRAYLEAFTPADPVLLVVKTSPVDLTSTSPFSGSPVGPGSAARALAHVIKDYPHPAPVHLVTRTLTDAELAALHRRGQCFVSLSRAEGWGLGAFDAAAYGNPVVATGWGGPLEYLDADTAWLVDFDLVPAHDPAPGTLYTSDQRWAEPSIIHAARQLRRVFEHRGEAAVRADRLRRRVHERYGPAAVAEAFVRAVASGLRRSA